LRSLLRDADDMTYKVTLPLPPSSNHAYVRRAKNYWKNGKKRRRVMDVLSDRAQAWMADARDKALEAVGDWECPDKTKVVVEVMVRWPDRRRRDCHNLSKLLCDALEGSVVKDDRYILLRFMDFEVYRGEYANLNFLRYVDFELDRENPRVEVKCYELG
jgi:Holliday junction resolvase RusA-like endonuclease